MEVSVDRAGRMVIPAPVRRTLRIGQDGGAVELEEGPEGIVLRPLDRPNTSLSRDEHGLLVIDVGRPVTAAELDTALAPARIDHLS